MPDLFNTLLRAAAHPNFPDGNPKPYHIFLPTDSLAVAKILWLEEVSETTGEEPGRASHFNAAENANNAISVIALVIRTRQGITA